MRDDLRDPALLFANTALAHAETQRDDAAEVVSALTAKDSKSPKIPEAKALLKAAEENVKAAKAALAEAIKNAPAEPSAASGGTAHNATIITS